MDRRAFLRSSGCAALGTAFGLTAATFASRRPFEEHFGPRPAYSIIPVVGDGRWVWTNPPEGQTGYLEPRDYELKVGIELEGTGNAAQIKASTVAPLELPEQRIKDVRIQPQGCEAGLRQLAPEAGQLMLAAPGIVAGQIVSAVATYRITLHKEYHAYAK